MAGSSSGKIEDEASKVLPDEAEARAALVLSLRRSGIGTLNVLTAIEQLPRRFFLAARYHGLAYENAALPIECGQVISSPDVVAFVAQALSLSKDHKVLEVGTGSGYQTAVLAQLCGQVFSLERYATLMNLAKQRLATLRIENVSLFHGDGLQGIAKKAPFDRIILNGSVSDIPDTLMAQLAPGGILIGALGPPGQEQSLVAITNNEGVGSSRPLRTIRSIALTPGVAKRL